MGSDQRVQREANHLIEELCQDNTNPGTGSRKLFKDVSYLRVEKKVIKILKDIYNK